VVRVPTIESPKCSKEPSPARHHSRQWLSGLSPLLWLVAATTLVQVLLRSWSAAGGWFYADDFWWHDLVETTSPAELMTLSLGGHFSPLTYLLNDGLTTALPFNWTSRVAVMMIGMLVANVGALLLARELWPNRLTPTITFVVLFAFTPFAAPNYLWYSQFGVGGILIIAGVWFAWAFARTLRDPTRWATLVTIGSAATALLVSERALLSLPVIVISLLVVLGHISGHDRVKATLVRYRKLWIGLGFVLLIYIPLYLANVEELPGSRGTDPVAVAQAAGRGVINTITPAIVGGPWLVDPTTVVAQSTTPRPLIIASALVVLSLAIVSIRRNRRASTLWLLLLIVALGSTTLVALGRLVTVGDVALAELRYYPDLALLVPLVLAAGFFPVRRLGRLDNGGDNPETNGVRPNRTLAVLLALFVLSSSITQVALGNRWHDGAAREFNNRLQTSIAQLRTPVVVDRQLPANVINPALLDQTLASRAFSIVQPKIRFDEATSEPWWITDTGQLVPASVIDGRVAQQGPNGDCGYLLTSDAPISLSLGDAAFDWKWWLKLDYFSTTVNRVTVLAGDNSVAMVLPAGVHSTYTPLTGKYSEISVQMNSEGSVACITAAQVGEPGPSTLR
jgi:hypothetical protein